MKVYANQHAAVQHAGTVIGVKRGDAYEHDDPIVVEQPWLFDGKPSRESRRVEQATAAPGEQRNR